MQVLCRWGLHQRLQLPFCPRHKPFARLVGRSETKAALSNTLVYGPSRSEHVQSHRRFWKDVLSTDFTLQKFGGRYLRWAARFLKDTTLYCSWALKWNSVDIHRQRLLWAIQSCCTNTFVDESSAFNKFILKKPPWMHSGIDGDILGWWSVIVTVMHHGFCQDFMELGHCAQGDSCILVVVLIRLWNPTMACTCQTVLCHFCLGPMLVWH